MFFNDILRFDYFRRNVGYCSTCNSVGVSIGMFTSSVCFVMLVSEKFRDTYIRTTAGSGGLITMQSTYKTIFFKYTSVSKTTFNRIICFDGGMERNPNGRLRTGVYSLMRKFGLQSTTQN